jgi:hypothetical protein
MRLTREEIEKCIVLCKNCHYEVEHENRLEKNNG